MKNSYLIKNAQLSAYQLSVDQELGGPLIDIRLADGFIKDVGQSLCLQAKETLIDAEGGAALPGLHDHHIHLLALAAARDSVICGPPNVNSAEQLKQVLQAADLGFAELSEEKQQKWLRGVAYHESVAGLLDRWQLDSMVSDRPLRIQHRSGKMWFLNSAAIEELALESVQDQAGIKRDSQYNSQHYNQINGRLFRMDSWLQERMGRQDCPDPMAVSQLLASYGVIGLTDTSPNNNESTWQLFAGFIIENKLLQRVMMMGDESLSVLSDASQGHALLERGALKIILDDADLPEFDQLCKRIRQAHNAERPVAIHCVTRTELVYALSALSEAGKFSGDRIEHASITPDEAIPLMHELGVRVVTQPGFIVERGDQYFNDVDSQFHDKLYRCQSLLNAGIPLAASTDAPYGSPDPWMVMRAAVNRTSVAGVLLGEKEKLSPEQALELFISPAREPGGVCRQLTVGAVADICLLSCPWEQARLRLQSEDVRATFRAGEMIFCRE